MFKIVDDNYQETVKRYELAIKEANEKGLDHIEYNKHPDSFDKTGQEIWIKIKILNFMGYDRLMYLLHRSKEIEGIDYLGFQVEQVGGDLVNKNDIKKNIIKMIDEM